MVGAAGFFIATLVNYVLSIEHVFETGIRFEKKREIFLVYLVSLIGLLINETTLYFCIDRLGTEMLVGKITATASVFFWNYLSRQHFIFREID